MEEEKSGFSFRVLHAKDFKEMKWKNGLGITTEMAVEPTGSTVNDESFLWRLSSAICDTRFLLLQKEIIFCE